jgi:hypothetical protein
MWPSPASPEQTASVKEKSFSLFHMVQEADLIDGGGGGARSGSKRCMSVPPGGGGGAALAATVSTPSAILAVHGSSDAYILDIVLLVTDESSTHLVSPCL